MNLHFSTMNLEKILPTLPQIAKEKSKENSSFFKKLQKNPPKQLDYLSQEIHTKVFEEIDCLQCANCCKTTGPLFTDNDIERIAKFMKIKPQTFIEKYLKIDEDNDFVLQQLPCTFLDAENYCMIYEHRPKACKEYPHTDRKKIYQIATITLKNASICPATYQFLEKIKAAIVKK